MEDKLNDLKPYTVASRACVSKEVKENPLAWDGKSRDVHDLSL